MICLAYKLYGNCSNPKCKCEHVEEEQVKVEEDVKSISSASTQPTVTPMREFKAPISQPKKQRSSRVEPTKTEVCFNFMKFGKCKFGDRCRYIHKAKPTREEKKTEVK